MTRRTSRSALLLVALAVACSPLTGDDGDRPAGPTADEFVAEVDGYLAALEEGDLDGAWAYVCQDGFGASDRDRFEDHHRDGPRPTGWELTYRSAGSGTGRGAAPGGGGGTPSGVEATVELDDGTRGVVRLLYATDGLCEIIGDDPVVTALHPAPTGEG